MFKKLICRLFGLMPVPKNIYVVLDTSFQKNDIVCLTTDMGYAERIASISGDYQLVEWRK